MVKIIFVEHDGTQHVIETPPGLSLMEAATRNNVPGIAADCGGACACATCHVYVDSAWRNRTNPITVMEEIMLDGLEAAAPNSRLACQIEVTEVLDGVVVRTPKSQY